MPDTAPADDTWRKSRSSQPTGNCVEVAAGGAVVRVRDSQDRSGTVLSFPGTGWRAFLAGAQGGQFDSPERMRLTAPAPR